MGCFRTRALYKSHLLKSEPRFPPCHFQSRKRIIFLNSILFFWEHLPCCFHLVYTWTTIATISVILATDLESELPESLLRKCVVERSVNPAKKCESCITLGQPKFLANGYYLEPPKCLCINHIYIRMSPWNVQLQLKVGLKKRKRQCFLNNEPGMVMKPSWTEAWH